MPSAVPFHCLSRRALRRRQLRRNLAWVISLFFLAGAFVGGFVWQRARSQRPAPGQATPETVSQAQQREARRLLDEAVRARYEERGQGAMNALAAARRADPNVPGLDVLAGEIALEAQDHDTLRVATREALRRDGNQASARLLAALEVWQRRDGLGLEQAGSQARQLLREAAESEPSNVAAHFFHGELSRQLGDSSRAHGHLLSALRRLVPWKSSALLQVKIHWATTEASEGGEKVEGPFPDAQSAAALRWRDALRTGTGAEEALGAMIALTPSLQTIVLLDDAALQTGDNATRIQALRRPLANAAMPSSSGGNSSP